MLTEKRKQQDYRLQRTECRVGRRSITCREGGVGLIEILVAIIILAVGFLAAARMQVTGIRYSQSAYFHSQAFFMAGDMIARMRVNVSGVQDGAYDDITTMGELQNPGCSTKMCTPAEIALQDRYDWSQHLYSASDDTGYTPLLPSNSEVTASGSVSQLANGGYSVTIVWADENDSVDGAESLRVDLFTEN